MHLQCKKHKITELSFINERNPNLVSSFSFWHVVIESAVGPHIRIKNHSSHVIIASDGLNMINQVVSLKTFIFYTFIQQDTFIMRSYDLYAKVNISLEAES